MTPEEVANEEYASFYRWLSHDKDDHMSVKHFRVEGHFEFRAMLFVPRQAFGDMFERKSNIKLCVRRVSKMDTCDKLMPEWLNVV